MLKKVVDHLGRVVEYEFPPKRIVSISPAITETLYAFGLKNEIVGRTRYCLYPEDKVKKASIVGGTKDINMAAVHSLRPDLIIAEKEDNSKEIVKQLEVHYPVYVAEVKSVGDAYRMMDDLGNVTDCGKEAEELVGMIKNRFAELPNANRKRVAYVIWRNPYMVVGKDTYIHSVLEEMGFVNPFSEREGRYPIVELADFTEANLDVVFLATEPFHFKEKHKAEFLEMMPGVMPVIVDGSMFWYGAKMVEAANYFRRIID